MIAQDSTDIQQEILNRVDIVAQKFSEIAPEAWGVLVRQQIIEAAMGLAALGFFTVLFGVGVVWGNARDWDDGPWLGLAVAGGLASLILVVCAFTEFGPQLLNPEYYALMELKP